MDNFSSSFVRGLPTETIGKVICSWICSIKDVPVTFIPFIGRKLVGIDTVTLILYVGGVEIVAVVVPVRSLDLRLGGVGWGG